MTNKFRRLYKTMKLITLTLLLAGLAAAQTPSGLLTGPVTYTSNLTSGNIYGDTRVFTVQNPDGTTYTCAANVPNQPSCYIVKNVVGIPYGNLRASDGTNVGPLDKCYTWDVSQLILNDVGYCQTSFYGNGSGETRVGIYCPNYTSSDINGSYAFNAVGCTFGGNSVVDAQAQLVVQAPIKHHTVRVWIPPYFRTAGHWENWQQIDSMSVTVTPQPSASSNIVAGPGDDH